MGRPKSNRKVSRLSVSLDDQDYETLKSLADKHDVSAAWLVRRAVTDFLKAAEGNRSRKPESKIVPVGSRAEP